MKCIRFLFVFIGISFFLTNVLGCGGGGDSGGPHYFERVCYTSSGDFEPYGTICDDGLCYNGTHSGICDGAGNCVVTEQVGYTGHCTVFISSGEFTGALGGLAGADRLCQSLADAEGLTGTFKAWLSDSTTSAAQRLTHSAVPYVDVWGRRVANDWYDLTSGTLQEAIKVDEKGYDYTNALGCDPVFQAFGVGSVWTNTRWDGTASGGPNCMDWTDNRSNDQGGEGGLVGFYCYATRGWTDPMNPATSGCAAERTLYCIQQ